jgi:hypothetical protein
MSYKHVHATYIGCTGNGVKSWWPVEVKVTIFFSTRQTIIHNCHFRQFTLFNNVVSASYIGCPFSLTSPPLRSTCEGQAMTLKYHASVNREAWWRRSYDWGLLKTTRVIVTSFAFVITDQWRHFFLTLSTNCSQFTYVYTVCCCFVFFCIIKMTISISCRRSTENEWMNKKNFCVLYLLV